MLVTSLARGPLTAGRVDEPVTRRLTITGRVQGVGYRDSMFAQAVRLGATGWVRNRRDGSVEATVCGTPCVVHTLIEWARRGPPSARVIAVEVSEGVGRFASFERKPSA